MPGMLDWKIKISADIKDLQNKMHKVEGELGEFEGKDHKVKLDLDTKTLESALKKLDSMLDSLGKGTGDFKQFETLSKDLAKVTSELSGFTKAFGKIDNSGTKSLLDMVQNIDKSLNNLSSHVTDVAKNLGNIGKDSGASSAVAQIENITKANEEAIKSTEKLAEARKKINDNVSVSTKGTSFTSNTSALQQEEKQIQKNINSLNKLLALKSDVKNVKKSSYSGKGNLDYVGIYHSQEEAVSKDLATKSNKLNASLNLILNEDKDAVQELESEVTKLKTSLQSVQDLTKRISKNSSINDLTKEQDVTERLKGYASAYQAIDTRLGELNNEYSLSNKQLEEYITLQAKAEKIMNEVASNEFGGVRGYGDVTSKAQLKMLVEESFAKRLGYDSQDVYDGLFKNISDANYDSKHISLFGDNGKKRSLKEVSAQILDYKSSASSLSGVFGANEDIERLNTLNSILNYIKTNEKEIANTDFTAQINRLTAMLENTSGLTFLEEELQELKSYQERLDSVKNTSIDSASTPSSISEQNKVQEELKETQTQAKKTKEALNESNISSGNTNPPSPPKKDRYAKRRKISEEDFLNYSPNRINEKLSNSGYTILGETVNTELVDGLVKVSAKIKDADGAWKSFSAKVDADGNIFEQRFKTVTNGVDKLETALENFGRETSPALTYQETLDKAQKIKNSLNLGDEYSIKVDSSEFVTITKKLTDVENAGASVTQTFKSAQDAIDNFGKAASNSAEKTSVALKSVKNKDMKDAFPDKDVSVSVESATNSIKEENNVLEQNTQKVKENTQAKEQNVNVNFNKYDKRLDSYNGKIDKYKTTISRFNDGGWTSDAYLKNVQAVKNAVDEYETLLKELKGKDASLVTSEDISKLDNYEKKIKDTIATVTNMSAAEKGYNFVSGQKELDKIHKLLNENSRMSSEAKAKIKAYYKEIESGNPSMSLDRIHGEIMKIYNAEVEAGRAGKSLIDVFKTSRLHQMVAQVAGMFSVYDVINGLKQVASTIRELDTAYTEMRKVSDESAQSLKNFQKESFSTADSVGTTALAMQDATATWMRLGESLDEAKESAKDATVLLNVSEFDNIDEATDSLVAMSQAYKDLDKMEIIDVLDKIGNEYSISTDQLSTALKDSAAVLKTQGNDLAESVALITAGNAITQDASKTAGETLPERYRNIFYRTYLTARAA